MLNIQIDYNDIQACLRLEKRQNAPIITKFLNRKTASAFLRAKKLTKKSIKGELLGLKDCPEFKIYINKSLTERNKELMYKVKLKKQHMNWKFVWSRNGIIYARKDDDSHIIRITINEKNILKTV